MKMSALAGIAVVIGLGLVLAACSNNLGRPTGGKNPYHHLEKGFRNPPDSPKRDIPFTKRLKFFGQAIWRNAVSKAPNIPSEHAIEREVAKAQLAAMGDNDFVSWIGHATFLVRLDGVNVLTDPVFSRRASPVSFAGPARLVPPGLRMEDLPPIDVVVISHAHYDHLDTATLESLPNKHRITAVVPLGLGKYFKDYGDVREVDWYDEVTLTSPNGGFKLTAYPAVHWSSRSLFDTNRTLWMSYGFSAGGHSVFHTGDTETHPSVFADIGKHMADNHGGCDLGLMSVGAYAPRDFMRGAHMDPEGGVSVGRDIGCKRMVPMHWGTFILSFEPFEEPRQRFVKAAGNQALVMKIGESVPFTAISE
ncbi:MAG TPA: hydrolase [Rhodobiaceae bacterium]|nr:hydrolase [Rhodobiaceae bacterium]